MNVAFVGVSIFWTLTVCGNLRFCLSSLGIRKYFVAEFFPLPEMFVLFCAVSSENRVMFCMCPFSCSVSFHHLISLRFLTGPAHYSNTFCLVQGVQSKEITDPSLHPTPKPQLKTLKLLLDFPLQLQYNPIKIS
jgi:hypothetical protein